MRPGPRQSRQESWERLKRLGWAGLNFFFPPQCVGCGRYGSHLCPDCAQTVEPVSPPFCLRCGRPQPRQITLCDGCRRLGEPHLIQGRAAALFREPLRSAIHRLKYENAPELAPVLARYLVATYRGPEWLDASRAVEAVVPVPLHRGRLAERGYNQSELLALAFARQVGLTVQPNWLERHQETRSQVGLTLVERLHNVADAFCADAAVAGKGLLLIDDVYTTGSTMCACVRAVLAQGAKAVYGLALAVPVLAEDLADGMV
jgi:competence protein ComFC